MYSNCIRIEAKVNWGIYQTLSFGSKSHCTGFTGEFWHHNVENVTYARTHTQTHTHVKYILKVYWVNLKKCGGFIPRSAQVEW